MEILVSLTVGALVAIGIWMMLDRGLLRVVLGVVVLGNGVNLAVFSAGASKLTKEYQTPNAGQMI